MTALGKRQRIVVGYDGSADARAALDWAARFASATDATVRVVAAWTWPISYGYPIGCADYAPEVDAKDLAERAVAELQLPADRVEVAVLEGSAGPVLVDASSDADLIVVGSRGHNAAVSALLGSVSAYCVHHSKVPVVVVR
ncbi:MAG TPA: universal stress protein [Mycobacteriales bacterium]|nr:universal stress protein [Mycobacteriales bacterium]